MLGEPSESWVKSQGLPVRDPIQPLKWVREWVANSPKTPKWDPVGFEPWPFKLLESHRRLFVSGRFFPSPSGRLHELAQVLERFEGWAELRGRLEGGLGL